MGAKVEEKILQLYFTAGAGGGYVKHWRGAKTLKSGYIECAEKIMQWTAFCIGKLDELYRELSSSGGSFNISNTSTILF